ncbi:MULTISPECIES: DUF4843 domain-containing protein [Sphingobacterium]|uniref:DUF4843 domain-containing protein n=2 Tax=Sphingobacterium TaxID=28453 RepID=A0ABX7CN10_SPHMU|nr:MULTISPECIES: DUF4843 domain-containing protein [Sphingobacterium]QQT31014.1 DUF4843 domain-containing protein [Sphingobacterium multivorum]QQT53053.1 DUF4843 domain-containing protein [Sphingobacterium multivorum]QRY58179.1 DUF4843 domain-containing protein [Sphingobacterium siyangense]RKF40902.1 hypothetical protein BCY89_20900 [Sphingobacterium siyangense]
MKQTISFNILGLLLISIFNSCKKDQYYIFNDISRLQFGPPVSALKLNEYTDSLKSETFYYSSQNVKQDTIYFDIYTIGETSKKDRSFKIQQDLLPGVENAIPGKHFVAFDDPAIVNLYVIRSDSVHARVPIVVLRDAELKNKTVNLGIAITPNENFAIGEPTKSWRKLQFTDRLSQPNAWTASFSTYYLGAYSVRKHQFMIEVTGQKWDQDFIANLPLDQISYYKSVLGMALIDYNKEHPNAPLRAENGDLITFPI